MPAAMISTVIATMIPAGVAASDESWSVLPASVVIGVSHMAPPVTGLVGVESIERMFPTLGQRAVIAVMRVEAVVDVAVESVRTVKPRSGADKNAVEEPVRTIIAVRSAIIRRILEVPVWAYGLRANVNAEADLGWRVGPAYAKKAQKTEQNNGFEQTHRYLRQVRVR